MYEKKEFGFIVNGQSYEWDELPKCSEGHSRADLVFDLNGLHITARCNHHTHRWGSKYVAHISQKQDKLTRIKTKNWINILLEEGIEGCQWCGRRKEELDSEFIPLEAHHIQPLHEVDNPEEMDQRDNVLLLCQACHAMQQYCENHFRRHSKLLRELGKSLGRRHRAAKLKPATDKNIESKVRS